MWPGWTELHQANRLRVVADAYGLTGQQRASLVDLGIVRADRTWLQLKGAAEHLGGGWARMWDQGVGDLVRRRRAWLVSARDDLEAALR